MKERKELTIGKALVYIIVLYIVFTALWGLLLTVIINLLANFLPFSRVIPIIAVIGSLIGMYISWKFSIQFTFKNKSTEGLNTKKIIGFIMLFITIVQIISTISYIYDNKKRIEQKYSNDFLEDRDVIVAFTQEELQERAIQNNNDKIEEKKQIYSLIIGQNVIALIINILIISLVPKKMLDKYNGITKIEKEIEK